MAVILAIESATKVCSVALLVNNTIYKKEAEQQNAHSTLLTSYIEELLCEAGINGKDLDAVVVSKGPGSYTGLRIGVSSAKGLCYALDKPLISVGTLEGMAAGMMKKQYDADALYCPMIDARRMEVYCALYDVNGKELEGVNAKVIDENSFKAELEKRKVIFFGDGASKCKSVIQHENAIIIDDFGASSTSLLEIGEIKYLSKEFEDVAYFEPYYLKDFIAGKPNVKGLR